MSLKEEIGTKTTLGTILFVLFGWVPIFIGIGVVYYAVGFIFQVLGLSSYFHDTQF